MKLSRVFIQTQLAMAQFTKIPNEMMNDLMKISDYFCDNTKFIMESDEKNFDSRLLLIRTMTNRKITDSYMMWAGFFDSADEFTGVAWMMANRAAIGYCSTHGCLEDWMNDEADKAKSRITEMTDDLLVHLWYVGYDHCGCKHSNPKSEWHCIAYENHDEAVRGVMTLVAIDDQEESRISQQERSEDIVAAQDIINRSGTAQKVTFEKDILKSVSHTETHAFNIHAEVSLEFGFSEFGVSASTKFSAGTSETWTTSDQSQKSETETFTFDLTAPPCSIVKGHISVEREKTEQSIGHIFEIDGQRVTINGVRVNSMATAQKYMVDQIEKIDDCEVETTENCSVKNIDQSIRPTGQYEWICFENLRKRICKALCTNGSNFGNEYRVFCTRGTESWFKFDSTDQLDCT